MTGKSELAMQDLLQGYINSKKIWICVGPWVQVVGPQVHCLYALYFQVT